MFSAQHDEEISKSLKSKHGLEDHPIKGNIPNYGNTGCGVFKQGVQN